MPVYVWKSGAWRDKATDEPLMFVSDGIARPMIMPDTPGYWSIASEKWIEGRAQRREDLKRTGCEEAGDRSRLNDGFCRNRDFARRHRLKWEGDR